jgi:hypothetical protein
MSEPTTSLLLIGATRADALEIGEYAGAQNVSFREQGIMDGSSGDIALGAVAIVATVVALRGLIAYLAARHRPEERTKYTFEQVRDGETKRITIDSSSIKGPFENGLATELATFSGIPVNELLSA